MKTIINGQERQLAPTEDTTTVDVLRNEYDLTGTKLVCGAGVCGACTVLVNGTPMTSCLLPAQHIADAEITTIEHFQGPNIHPIQRAFMAHDGLQCGYCTPGFVIEGIAFYERWRTAHGTTEPARDDVAAALAGHLCRCGAYSGIYQAVQRACAGDFDQASEVEPARVDALAKVTGMARYTADIRHPEQLIGNILRSPHAFATITTLDLQPAREMEGVHAVFAFVQVGELVRYVGEEIAAIAATDEATAEAALQAIQISYQHHPAVFDINEAMEDSAPTIWPEGTRKQIPNANEGPMVPGKWQNNQRLTRINVGSIRPSKALKALNAPAAQDVSFKGQYNLAAQIHTAFEPHSCVAVWQGHDSVSVHLSTQAVSAMVKEIADHFDLSEENVQVHGEYVGGAFGAKLGLTGESIAAITLARQAQKPVSVVFNRGEEMLVGGFRPAAQVDMALVADQYGALKGLRAHAKNNAGVGINSMVALLMRLTYAHEKIPRELIDTDVVTNMAPGKPFRGPGGPIALWALEQSVDQLAHDLKIDPITLRRQWDQNDIRTKVYDWVEQLPAWRDREQRSQTHGRYRRGIGVSVGFWAHFYDPQSQVEVRVSKDGISAHTASQDMGNGSRTVVAKAVAEVFGVNPSAVQVEIGHSPAVYGPRSGGSRTTSSLWAPAQEAALKVRRALVKAFEAQTNLGAIAVDGGIQTPNGRIGWNEVFAQVPPQTAVATRGGDKGLMASLQDIAGRYGNNDISIGQGTSGAAYVCEVEVDTLLGKVQVNHVWGAVAVGKIHVPALARSQVYGGIIQGLGYALYEEKVLDPHTGRSLTMGLEDYRIPGIGDIPPMEIDFIEAGFEHVKGGGVGIAEIAKVPMPAAVANAVFHATGWRPFDAPIRPDRVLKGVQS